MTTTRAFIHDLARSQSSEDLGLQCPRCNKPLGSICFKASSPEDARACPRCGSVILCIDGIWRALPTDRAEHFESFISDYEFIRRAEGRGSQTSGYYLALPEVDVTGKNSAQWAIRARTFHQFVRGMLPTIASKYARPLRILDLGAGNGWLSARLAKLGHHPVAVDLLVNDTDGLAASEHFREILPNLFPRIQAEHDHLPFADSSFDLVIFNASFHYSEDYERTLREAFRVGAKVVIADTPWYAHERSGKAMVSERRRLFALRFGIPSDSIPSLEYLTPLRIHQLGTQLDIRWTIQKPWYGMRWALRPLVAFLYRRREPSRFFLYLIEPV